MKKIRIPLLSVSILSLVVALSSCKKDDDTIYPQSSYIKYLGYASRTMEINLTPETDKVNIPIIGKLQVGHSWIGGLEGDFAYSSTIIDSTTAIPFVQYVVPKVQYMERISLEENTWAQPLKLYPDRITEPVRIMLVGKNFDNWLPPYTPAIGTLTILINPVIQ